MSKARLVITAVTIERRTLAEVARTYGVSQVLDLRAHGPLPRRGRGRLRAPLPRPKTSPGATPPETVELVLRLRKQLAEDGLDAGADTLGWHLTHHHETTLSRATIHRILTRHGAVTPEPKKRPKSSYIRFEAAMPNETWQSDFTHYRLTDPDDRPGADVEIITWLDDCTRYALHVSAHRAITTPIVTATFRKTAGQHGIPASTLTDNGMVYTVRLAGIGRRGGRNGFEQQLRDWHVVQKNSRPNHPTTCGKVERFQQTMKKWLRAQPDQPATIARAAGPARPVPSPSTTSTGRTAPCRTGPPPQRSTTPCPRPLPGPSRDADTHDRIRHDRVDKSGTVTLRVAGRLQPHRRRPNPRGNPRHPARPGPRGPGRQRHHRRTPPRAHHRPQTRTTSPAPRNDKAPEPTFPWVRVSAMS